MADETFDHVVLNVMDRCTNDSFIYKCFIQNGILSGYDIMLLNEKIIDSMFYIPTDNNGNIAQRVGLHFVAKNRLNILVKYLRSATSELKGHNTTSDFIQATNKNDYNNFRFLGTGRSYGITWSTSDSVVSHLESNIIPIVEFNIIPMVDSTFSILNKSLVDKTVNNIQQDDINSIIILNKSLVDKTVNNMQQDDINSNIIHDIIKSEIKVIVAERERSPKETVAVNINKTCNVLLQQEKQLHDVTFSIQKLTKQHHYITTLLYYYNKNYSTTNKASNALIIWYMFGTVTVVFVNAITVFGIHQVYDENCIYDPGGSCFWSNLLNYTSNDLVYMTTFVHLRCRLWRGNMIRRFVLLRLGLWRGVKISSVLV